PSDLEKSEFLFRIHDEEDPMPPEKAERQLTDADREILSRWVKQGGEYSKHWAYVPPTRDTKQTIDDLVKAGFADDVDFSPAADKATLARRTALTLTGLPPELDQLERFLKDDSDGAFEKLVDELMASPRYGEHQARYWLDAVRYGDTHGLHLDNRRGIFPYRDWVVRALNRNQPFDEFLKWQIAGDLLPDPNLEHLVATGFVRMNPSTAEGGAIPEEFQAKNNFDRVETLGTALLGASLVCARCHTHKYDPIPMQEYYELKAFFNSTAEGPMDGNAYIYGPHVKAPPNVAAWEQWEKLTSERSKILAKADLTKIDAALKLANSAKGWKTGNWKMSKAVDRAADAPPAADWKPAGGFPGESGRLPRSNQAVWVWFTIESPVDQILRLEFSSGDDPQLLVDGAPVANPGTVASLSLTKGIHAVRLKLTGSDDKLPILIRVDHPWDALAKSQDWEACSEEDQLAMLAAPNSPMAGEDLRKNSNALLENFAALEASFTTTLIAKDLPNPRETKMLERGEYDSPIGDVLIPDVFSVMGEMQPDAPRNRMGLVQWLTSDEHPLVSRVLINRVWQQVFGYGLVRTPEEFGLQGEHPTNPELLDWLAIEFRESGWDLQHMLKLMVSSRTFQQQSKWRDGIQDPENRLFARGPNYRLDAEVLRDTALWASGLLSPEMGGEGVKPWQPKGMWSALMHPASNTKSYVPDTDDRVYRRSLYVYWKRTSPHPMMTLFDAPNRESSCVRRSRSNTPLQSLGLLNENQRTEMSRALARRLMAEGGDNDESRLTHLFKLLASRAPNDVEKGALLQLLKTTKARYDSATDDAKALAGVEESASDLAAWTQVASVAMASDVSILIY
ncbi:MAG: DUF1549 and DUF1553 domain-containing protein, partial [Verrucomicrobiota bacterium]